MKKLLVAALIAVVGLAFVVPASALETEFGGYWRTRFFSYNSFTGEDQTEAYDYNAVDTRTRLYFTAKINDNLKLVNKFEMDADWGSPSSYSDIGADAKVFEIKNSYADFTMGALNAKVGAQGATLARGFLFSDDFIGAVITYNGGGFSLPFVWIRPYGTDNGKDVDDGDVDYVALSPVFTSGAVKINPLIMYAESDDISSWNPALHGSGVEFSFDGVNTHVLDVAPTAEELDIFWLGLNLDVDMGAASLWFTGIYETGTIDVNSGDDIDVDAYLLALGANMGLGAASIHGQMFYASGQDEDDPADELNRFWVPSQGTWYGQSYYWAEIMGYGIMDDMVSNGSCADKISNIIAYNIGASVKPMDKLKLKADLWYAVLAEEEFNEDELGFEIDLGLTYELVENLNLDLIAAYLFAGDRTNMDPTTGHQFSDEADPYELGARLSLSF